MPSAARDENEERLFDRFCCRGEDGSKVKGAAFT
jgi:hypothetical protein